MLRSSRALACILLVFLTTPSLAQLAPPTVRIARPFSVAPGESVTLEFRGTNLDGASGLWFDDPRVEVKEIKLAEGDDARLGRKLTAAVRLPADLTPRLLRVRVVTPRGLSNPAPLRVGRALATRQEQEPNNRLSKAQAVAIPVAIEGAIEPGDDVDLFAVDLKAGATLVAEAIAGRAGSGLDPLLTIFTPDGRELASDDDAFGRDAAVSATVPATGRYVVQIQDANGRNRDNNIEQKMAREYRLELGLIPLVTGAFPPGGRRGQLTRLQLFGANLPDQGVYSFEPASAAPLGDAFLPIDANPTLIRIGDAPETAEVEPNHDIARIQEIAVPAALNGVLAEPDDVDLFRLKAGAGQEGDYRITVYAARVGSPADPVLTILNDKGDPQGEDDDKLGRDARIERAIDSADGIVLGVRDYFNRGGPRYVYRVEIEPIGRRGVTVTAEVGACAVPRQGSVALPVKVERRGFDGPVTLLAGELPQGVSATPITIGPQANGAFLVLSAAADAPLGPYAVRLVARDLPMPAAIVIREPSGEMTAPVLAVAEPAALGVRLEPATVVVPPGGQATVKIHLDRRSPGAKKGVKARLLPLAGELGGLEAPPELTIAADATEATVTLKARPDAPARRLACAVRARFEDAAEALGVCSDAIDVVVPERNK